jgi:hypothetical protein
MFSPGSAFHSGFWAFVHSETLAILASQRAQPNAQPTYMQLVSAEIRGVQAEAMRIRLVFLKIHTFC